MYSNDDKHFLFYGSDFVVAMSMFSCSHYLWSRSLFMESFSVDGFIFVYGFITCLWNRSLSMDSISIYGFILFLWIHSILGLWIHSLFMEPYSVYGFIFHWVHSKILDFRCCLWMHPFFMELFYGFIFMDSFSVSGFIV